MDKKNHRTGMYISAAIHLALVGLFFLIIAWQKPDPPVPEYGILLNFGTVDAGSGDMQPEEETAAAEVPEEIETPEEVVEDIPVEEPVEVVEPVEAVEESVPMQEEGPDVIEEPVPEPIPEPTPKPIEEPEPTPEPVPEPKPTLDERAMFPGVNQGDTPGAVGDQGDKEGSVDSKAMMGTAGGGGNGDSYSMDGWAADSFPRPKENSNATGKIVFEISIDDTGAIIGVRVLTSEVSPEILKLYKDAVSTMTFTRKVSNSASSSIFKGIVTYSLKSE